MKRMMKSFAGVWAICIALFNAIVFLTPIERNSGFWIGYLFITLAFWGQLCCAYCAFRAQSLKKLFYNIPLVTVSYTGLIAMLAAGSACMVIPGMPDWLGVIICFAVLGVTAIAVIGAGTAASMVNHMDEQVALNTFFIKKLTVEAEGLMHRANAPMLKNQCKRVYEALRYSNPKSNKALSDVEQRIREEFDVLTDAVADENLDCTESAAKELLILIAQRNQRCKANK